MYVEILFQLDKAALEFRKGPWSLWGQVVPSLHGCLFFLEPTQLSSILFSLWFILDRGVWIICNQRDFNRPTELKSPWGVAQMILWFCQRTFQCFQQVMFGPSLKGWDRLDGIIPASTDPDHTSALIWLQIKGSLPLATGIAFGLGGSTGQAGPRNMVPAEVVQRSWIVSPEPGV